MDELNQQASVPQTLGKSHGSKMMLFILGAVILLVGIVGYSLGANKAQAPVANNALPKPSVSTTDETANWKTYVNTKVGFEIKYPSSDKVPSFVIGDFGGQSQNVDGNEDNKVIEFPGSDLNFEIAFSLEIFPYAGSLEGLSTAPAQLRLYGYSGLEKPAVFKRTSINDNQTIWFKRTETTDERYMGKSRYEIYLIAKNHAFIFHTNYYLSENDIDQILSTFKFTQ